MRIEVDNHTRWNTADLRRLYKAALRQAGAKPTARALLVVHYRRSRSTDIRRLVHGRAFIRDRSGPGRCTMLLPALPAVMASSSPISFLEHVAQVMHHEALHACGAFHKDMTEEQYWSRQPVSWAMSLDLRWVGEEKVDRAAAHTDKLEHSRGMLRRAETRAKRAATILKKWRRRVAALERKTP